MKFFLSAIVLLIGNLLVAAEPWPETAKTQGMLLGCQAYTFRQFSVMEAIEKTAAVGGKIIEFYPGQLVSKENPDVKFDQALAPEWIDKVKSKLSECGVMAAGFGVVSFSGDEAEARSIFEFVKRMGIRVIGTESVLALDTLEKLAREYDIKVGFHEHQKRPDDASYKLWDPSYVLELVKNRDPRIGACTDTGHWVRSGIRPVDGLKILSGRIVSCHLKDVQAPLPSAKDVRFGEGVSDVEGILKEFQTQGFSGPLFIEFESNPSDNVSEVKACIDFVLTHGAAK